MKLVLLLLLLLLLFVASSGLSSGLSRGRATTNKRSLTTMSSVDQTASSSFFSSMKTAASQNIPFTTEELDSAIKSLRNVALEDCQTDWAALRELLATSAHLSHKDWTRTETAASALADIIAGPDDSNFRSVFKRVLEDGNWDAAVTAATSTKANEDTKPWVVLVTGLNGIRKTTSAYQSWFKKALKCALGDSYNEKDLTLPSGEDSFFRQLDYMLCTVSNEEFKQLYEMNLDTELYSSSKDAIFARYRTFAEMVGALLCKASIAKGINVMVETSGRDIAMFDYIDHFFGDSDYKKLVIHFTINDIRFAERSVDTRMQEEMKRGSYALDKTSTVRDIIACNAGGPYGSAVLKGVQADSDRVWSQITSTDTGEGEVASKFNHWYKASLQVNAVDPAEGDWYVCSMKDGIATSKPFYFTRLEE